MVKNKDSSSTVKMLNYLKKESSKFVGRDKPFPSLSQLVNTAVREYLSILKRSKK